MTSDKELYQSAKARILAAAARKEAAEAEVSLLHGKATVHLRSYASGTVIWELSTKGKRYKAPGSKRSLAAMEALLMIAGIEVRDR